MFTGVEADCGRKVDINSGKQCQSFNTMAKLWKIMNFLKYLMKHPQSTVRYSKADF